MYVCMCVCDVYVCVCMHVFNLRRYVCVCVFMYLCYVYVCVCLHACITYIHTYIHICQPSMWLLVRDIQECVGMLLEASADVNAAKNNCVTPCICILSMCVYVCI